MIANIEKIDEAIQNWAPVDFWKAFEEKLAHNRTRGFKHGEARYY